MEESREELRKIRLLHTGGGSVTLTVYRQCKDDHDFFTMYQKRIVTSTFCERLERKEHIKFPMKLLEKFVEIDKLNGAIEVDDSLHLNKKQLRKEKENKLLLEKTKKKLARMIDEKAVKSSKISKEEFKKTFGQSSRLLFNLAKDSSTVDTESIKTDMSIKLSRLAYSGDLATGKFFIKKENREELAKEIENRLKEAEEFVDSYKRGQSDEFKAKAEAVSAVLSSIIIALQEMVKENFPSYTKRSKTVMFGSAGSMTFEHYSVKDTKLYLLNTIRSIRKAVKETLLNEDMNMQSIYDKPEDKTKTILKSFSDEYVKRINTLNETAKNTSAKKIRELLDKTGTKMKKANKSLVDFVKKDILHNPVYRVKAFTVWQIYNTKTRKKYEETLANDGNNANEQLLWHGSPNKNWKTIITKGLSLDYAGTGMFGKGIYFADESKKSYGYTSGMRSKWHHGNNTRLYLAVFKVNLGKTYSAKGSLNACPKGFDSVSALHNNTTLHMNEYVIYDNSRCTIEGLVEIILDD